MHDDFEHCMIKMYSLDYLLNKLYTIFQINNLIQIFFLPIQGKFSVRGKGWCESTRNHSASSWVPKLRFATKNPNYQVNKIKFRKFKVNSNLFDLNRNNGTSNVY